MREFESIFRQAQQTGCIDEADTTLFFFDIATLRRRLAAMKKAFPASAKHTVAVKTQAVAPILSLIADSGIGHEAASAAEVLLAARSSDQWLVYDGPAKTRRELEMLLPYKKRLLVNANSLRDLEKLSPLGFENLGLRINTGVQPGVNQIFDVSKADSKFGVHIRHRKEILEAYAGSPSLTGLHFHLGSGMTSITPFEKALEIIAPLLEEIDRLRKKAGYPPLKFLDIGGGLQAEDDPADTSRIRDLGDLFSGPYAELANRYTLITEMGQYFHTHAAWVCTKIEDILPGDPRTLILHAGANLFLRQAYTEVPPPFQYALLGRNEPANTTYHLAGPLCFSGDYIQKNVALPSAQEEDYLIIDRAGANTLSLYSYHCSFPMPKVIGYGKGSPYILKDRQTEEDLLRLWGCEPLE